MAGVIRKVIVIEDQTILLDLICKYLESIPTFEIVGRTGDGREGYELCLKHRPDFLILDIMLPNLNGMEILDRLKNKSPRTRILVFSATTSVGVVRKVLEAGVDGFLEKDAGLEETERAIERVADGHAHFSPTIMKIMSDVLMKPELNDAVENLTSREREIIQLVAESNSTKEIASELNISVRTADTHRSNIMRKLGIHDVAGLTRYAIIHGLVEVDETI
jgi:DNA-binding NarL/FixJ family response regulator